MPVDVGFEQGRGDFGKPVFQPGPTASVNLASNSIRRRIVADAAVKLRDAGINHTSQLCPGHEHQVSTEGCLLGKAVW